MPGMAERMSQADYARHRGVSRQAISKLVKAGKIPLREDGTIDPGEADTLIRQTRERVRAVPQPRVTAYAPPAEGAGLTKARTATEIYRARTAQLEYEKAVGRLISIDAVQRAMEGCAAALAREIDQIVSRADDMTAAVQRGGVAGAREFLRSQARLMRDTLARTMTIRAGGEDGED